RISPNSKFCGPCRVAATGACWRSAPACTSSRAQLRDQENSMRLIVAIAASAALIAACSPATEEAEAPQAAATDAAPQGGASQRAAAAGTNCQAPAPTAVTVTGEMTREGQIALLAHPDPKLAANKRLVWDMWRTLLNGYHIDRADEYIHPDYIQHNPMANTGLDGMQGFFRSLGIPPREIPEAIPEGVIAVM